MRSCISSWHPWKWAWTQWLPSGCLTSRSVGRGGSSASLTSLLWKCETNSPSLHLFVWKSQPQSERLSISLCNWGNPDFICLLRFPFTHLLRCSMSEGFKIGCLDQENNLGKTWILKTLEFFLKEDYFSSELILSSSWLYCLSAFMAAWWKDQVSRKELERQNCCLVWIIKSLCRSILSDFEKEMGQNLGKTDTGVFVPLIIFEKVIFKIFKFYFLIKKQFAFKVRFCKYVSNQIF